MKKIALFTLLLGFIISTSYAKDKVDDSRYEIEMAEVRELGHLS